MREFIKKKFLNFKKKKITRPLFYGYKPEKSSSPLGEQKYQIHLLVIIS